MKDAFDFAAGEIARVLGEDITYNGATVPAVFGSGFVRTESGEIRISSRRPELMVRLADLVAPPLEKDLVVVRGRSYEVATVRPDVEDVSATLVLKAID